MSNDYNYFYPFYEDLRNHRFSLIINEPIRIVYQENELGFNEENNIYVKWVLEPLLCYYEPVLILKKVGVELLVSRTQPLKLELNC